MIRARSVLHVALCLGLSVTANNLLAQQSDFPFDDELRLDASPMPGDKRVPTMEIAPNGSLVLDLWCNHVEGQVVIAADTITLIMGQLTERSCTPARAAADADLIAALGGVTNWRRQGAACCWSGRTHCASACRQISQRPRPTGRSPAKWAKLS
jgi:heat shock protein HslJ